MSVTDTPVQTSDETLALEAGDGPVEAARPRGVSNVATALFVAGDFMALYGLVGAYYALRAEAFVWPPKGLTNPGTPHYPTARLPVSNLNC